MDNKKRFLDFDTMIKSEEQLDVIEVKVFDTVYRVKTDMDIITAMKIERRMEELKQEGKDNLEPEALMEYLKYFAEVSFGKEVVASWYEKGMTDNQLFGIMLWVSQQLAEAQTELLAKQAENAPSNPPKAPRKRKTSK